MGAPLFSPATGVIVTGGASGIGLACARALAEVGRPVALWDIEASAAGSAAEAIRAEYGVAACAEGFDVRDLARIAPALETARQALGSLGGLVHSAGVSHSVPVGALKEEDWDLVLDVNLKAYAFLVRELLPDLRANPGSAVVGIASINAILGNAANPAYGASKSGLLGLTRSLADFLAADGVRANAICPGYVETPMLAGPMEAAAGLRERLEQQAMLGRLAQPEEIGRVARFLLSDDASFVTAEHVVVDGGVVRSQR